MPTNRFRKTALLSSATAIVLAACLATPANAQSGPAADQAAKPDDGAKDVVVTGSRIRRTSTDTPAPVNIVTREEFDDRGYVTAGQALNSVTAITPSLPQTAGNAQTLRDGAQFPNLFNLGAGRTLTLIDGRRMVTTSSGLGDRVVDTNVVPIGLVERVDVVQAGGAAVYGSDAVAGVVNYVLRKNFHGLEIDAQSGISSRGDYPERSLRLTAGERFAGGRGNIAIDLEWSKSEPLSTQARPTTYPYTLAAANPADTGPSDGIPSTLRIPDTRFYAFNPNGVIFTIPAPVALPPCGNQICFLRVGGVAQQFTADGTSLQAYNPGMLYTVPFANGGDGESFGDLASLFVGVERRSANVLGHYDLTDNLTFSALGTYTQVTSYDPLGGGQAGVTKTVLNNAASGAGPLAFTKANPYLTTAQVTALSAASPSFAAGGPLYLSKAFPDLLTSNASLINTRTYRGVAALDGKFSAGERRFDYSLSFSHAEVHGTTQTYGLYNDHFNNAIASARNAAGQIVCSINAVTVTDANCAPIDPFGNGNVSAAARAYVSVPSGSSYSNRQEDILATVGGDVVRLPAGTAKFSLGYEHRAEAVTFTPATAVVQGLILGATTSGNRSGSFHTDEFSGEVLLPLVGGDFTLPLVHRLEVNGQYRRVSNSIAGREDVWGINGQWEPTPGVTFRASRSRNFRAPTLDQLFAPTTTGPGGILIDPCDARYVNSGPNPATRRANCVALFTANPLFGTSGTRVTLIGTDATTRLAGWNDANANAALATLTTTGNPNLHNEVSNTLTFGLVLQPHFIPGLVITADRIQVDIRDGLIGYSPSNFQQACFDATPQPAAYCGTFTRNSTGDIITGLNTTVNAASITYRGEVYKLDYNVALSGIFGGGNAGRFGIGLELTHNRRLTTVAAGVSTEAADTTLMPDWVTKLDLRYQIGAFRLTYEGIYLPKSRVNSFDTIETTPTPVIAANWRHSIGATVDIKRFQFRFGVTNLTDKLPSYPTTNYGDILGRRFYAGARVKI